MNAPTPPTWRELFWPAMTPAEAEALRRLREQELKDRIGAPE